jgi:hypothetical protein
MASTRFSAGVVYRMLALGLSLMIGLVVAEMILRAVEKRRQASRLDYGDTVGDRRLGAGGLLVPDFDAEVTDDAGHPVRWTTNSAGFRNSYDASPAPAPGTLRFLTLGDSFAAGFRVDQRETFSHLLEAWLEDRCTGAEVLVSMIEEPATGLFYLAQHGVGFSPHVVLLGITIGNDISQNYLGLDNDGEYSLRVDGSAIHIDRVRQRGLIGFRHGLEDRVVPTDCLRSRSVVAEAVWLAEYLRARLRLVRLIDRRPRAMLSWYKEYRSPRTHDPMHGLGFFLDEPPDDIEEAYDRLFRVLEGYRVLLETTGIEFVVAVFPQRFQVQPRDWSLVTAEYGLEPSCFDLSAPNLRIRRFCEANSITFVDPTTAMARNHRATGADLYQLSGDMHWNSRGHRAFFEVLSEALAPLVQDFVECGAPRSFPSPSPSPITGHAPQVEPGHLP